MPSFKLIKKDAHHYSVEGHLTFLSITKKSIKSFKFLNSANNICIDLKKVKLSDSAGLALLIEWIKHSKLYQTQLSFINIPEQLLTLAKLSGFKLNEDFYNIN